MSNRSYIKWIIVGVIIGFGLVEFINESEPDLRKLFMYAMLLVIALFWFSRKPIQVEE